MNIQKQIIRLGYTLLGLKQGPEKAPPLEEQNVHKILVVRNDNLGDVLLTVPALHALRQAFPRAYLAVLVNGYTRPALEGIPWIDKIYSYDKFKHGKHPTRLHAWWQQYQLIKELQQEGFDLAVGIRAGFSSSHGHLVYSTGAKWRLGPAPDEKRKNLGFFYNLRVPKASQKKHEVERALDVVRTIGVDTTDKGLEFFIPSSHKQQINDWLKQQGLRPPLVGVQLSQRLEENRSWSIDKYGQLIRALQEKPELTPILIYAPFDAATAKQVQQLLSPKVAAFSTPDLKLLGALLSRCQRLIILEGGAMHLAAAVGTPTIAVFGKTDQRVWHPWGKGHLVLKKGNQENMVSVEEVLNALESAD